MAVFLNKDMEIQNKDITLGELADKVKTTILFSDSNGQHDNITLLNSIANYSRIRVYGKIAFSAYTTNFIQEFSNDINNSWMIGTVLAHTAASMIFRFGRYKITTNKLNLEQELDARIGEGGGVVFNNNTSSILITKIEGLK